MEGNANSRQGAGEHTDLEEQVRLQTAEFRESRDLLDAVINTSLDRIHALKAIRDIRGEIIDFEWILMNEGAFPGMGLGLYISAQIIHRHGGTISVKSKPGEGSVFSFTIPYSNSLGKL